jgi:hypothetical protein
VERPEGDFEGGGPGLVTDGEVGCGVRGRVERARGGNAGVQPIGSTGVLYGGRWRCVVDAKVRRHRVFGPGMARSIRLVGDEPHRVARFEERGGPPRGIEEIDVDHAADEMPSTGSDRRVDTGVRACDADASRGDARPGGGAPRDD